MADRPKQTSAPQQQPAGERNLVKEAMDAEQLTSDIYKAMQVQHLSERHDAIKKLLANRLSALLDELEADGPKNIYTLEEVAEMNKHLDSRTQQSALDKSAGILETNDQWRALLAKKREAAIDTELDRLKGKDAG